jgi:hypothetical protein
MELQRQSTSAQFGNIPAIQSCKDAMVTYGIHRRQQVASGIGFHNVSPGPSLQSFPHHLWGVVLGYKQNLKSRAFLSQQTARFQTIHPGHGDIEHHDIWIEVLRLFDSFRPVGRFSDDLPARMPLKQCLQTLSYNRVIINQQYANCHSVSVLWGDQTIRHM